MVALTAWAWILGVVGLAVAVILHVGLRRAPAAESAAALRRGFRSFLRRQYIVLAIFVVVAGALLGWATTPLTGLAFLTGAVCSVLAGLGGLRAAADVGARAGRTQEPAPPLGAAFSAGSVLALGVSSFTLLGLGLWYMFRGAGAITDVDFQAFAALAAGFALGAACAALFARVGGAVQGGDRVLAVPVPPPAAPPPGAEVPLLLPTVSLTDAAGRLLAGIGGTGADLFGSLAGAVVASMALGAGVPQYSSSRQEALALPLLLVAAGLVAALVGVGVERAMRRVAGAVRLRTAALVATGVFLLIAYAVVRLLHFQIVDPTGARVFHGTAPFLGVLFGAIAALLIGIGGGLAAGRLLPGPDNLLPAERLGLAPGAAVTPALVLGVVTWASYYLGGLYCLGITALGLTVTACVSMALSVLAPILDGAAAATRGEEPGPPAAAVLEVRALTARTGAMGQAMAVSGAALTAIATLSAFASLVGLPEGTLDLLDAPVLPGLLVGIAVPFAFAAAIVSAMRRGAIAGAAEAERQLEAIPGLARGRAHPDVGAAMGVAARAALAGTIVPGLLAIVLPIVAGLLSLTFLGGLLGGAILVAFVLAAAMTPAETTMAAAAPALNSLVKVMALVALTLAAWFAGILATPVSNTSLLHGVRPLLALLGG